MSQGRSTTRKKDWYSVSVDTLRAWALFLLLALTGVLGYFGYRYWEHHLLEREAAQAIDDVRLLVQSLKGEAGAGSFKKEYDSAWEGFEQARASFQQGAFQPALESATSSRNLLQWILDAVRQGSELGEAQFISVGGSGVEYRHGETGDWEEAKSRVTLRSGDYVRTGANGSAEIMFTNGTLYTVRPSTLFIVSRARSDSGTPGEQSIKMEYGWVNLNTARRPSQVSTPNAEARVKEESDASVTYEKGADVARFTAFRGGIDVAAAGGLTREVSELQEVVQTHDLLSQPRAVPRGPEPLEPADNYEADFDKVQRLVLSWAAVEGATRYALQVSRSHLFVDNVIDVENRSKTSATLGLRSEGTFEWRVAAIGRDGIVGPWSASRRFHVASFRGGGAEGDAAVPPTLEITDVKAYGSIFILTGTAEPGSTVEVNGEQVKVAGDGTFTKTVQLIQEGWGFIEIRARDARGNETVRRQRVFVESL